MQLLPGHYANSNQQVAGEFCFLGDSMFIVQFRNLELYPENTLRTSSNNEEKESLRAHVPYKKSFDLLSLGRDSWAIETLHSQESIYKPSQAQHSTTCHN